MYYDLGNTHITDRRMELDIRKHTYSNNLKGETRDNKYFKNIILEN